MRISSGECSSFSISAASHSQDSSCGDAHSSTASPTRNSTDGALCLASLQLTPTNSNSKAHGGLCWSVSLEPMNDYRSLLLNDTAPRSTVVSREQQLLLRYCTNGAHVGSVAHIQSAAEKLGCLTRQPRVAQHEERRFYHHPHAHGPTPRFLPCLQAVSATHTHALGCCAPPGMPSDMLKPGFAPGVGPWPNSGWPPATLTPVAKEVTPLAAVAACPST